MPRKTQLEREFDRAKAELAHSLRFRVVKLPGEPDTHLLQHLTYPGQDGRAVVRAQRPVERSVYLLWIEAVRLRVEHNKRADQRALMAANNAQEG